MMSDEIARASHVAGPRKRVVRRRIAEVTLALISVIRPAKGTRCSTRWEPMKLPPPVTRYRIFLRLVVYCREKQFVGLVGPVVTAALPSATRSDHRIYSSHTRIEERNEAWIFGSFTTTSKQLVQNQQLTKPTAGC